MFVGSKKREISVYLHAGLFANLSTRGFNQVFSHLDAARRNLCPSVGVITVVEYEQPVFAFDIDQYALSMRHPLIVGQRLGRLGCASVRRHTLKAKLE